MLNVQPINCTEAARELSRGRASLRSPSRSIFRVHPERWAAAHTVILGQSSSTGHVPLNLYNTIVADIYTTC